ncbi:MAG: hypothetical protein M3Y42_08000 [Actinomycetota bacterium]|nr:hypothetical protein [Actinomycetota bacterium]MDQ2956891.1 hypothetical protein [Actinomycetota bacterium]
MSIFGPGQQAMGRSRWRGLDRSRASLVLSWERRPLVARSAALVRLVVAALGVAMMLVPAHPKPVPVFAIAFGLLFAVASPARAGGALVVSMGIWGWLACYGVHGSPPVVRTLMFAAVLYLLHSSIALAAGVPLGSRLEQVAAQRWALRCGLHLAIAGVLAWISYLLSSLVGSDSTYGLEVAGLVGLVGVLTVIVWLFSRTLR